MSYQEIYSSPLIQQQDKPILSNNPFMTCWCWTVQIFVWIAFFVLVFSIIQGRVQGPYAFLLIYIIYVVSELCSPTLSYLIHQKSKDNLYTRMGEIFGATPSISFHCVCYHYEMKQVLYKDSKGNNQIRAERKRVDTFTDEMTLHYYSVRDVSGLFLLDEIDSVKNNKIAYIILHLEKKINFSDCISYADYILQKDAFWKRNRYRDSLMDFNEYRTIPGFKSEHILQIGDFKPNCISTFKFVLWTLLMMAQIYKKYVDSFCIYQTFKIRKLISTRFNLLSPLYNEQYKLT